MDNHVVDQRLSTYIASSSSSTYSALSFHSYSRAGIEVLCSPMYHPTSILQNDTKCIRSKHIYIYVYIMNFYTPSNIIRIIYIYKMYPTFITPTFMPHPPSLHAMLEAQLLEELRKAHVVADRDAQFPHGRIAGDHLNPAGVPIYICGSKKKHLNMPCV